MTKTEAEALLEMVLGVGNLFRKAMKAKREGADPKATARRLARKWDKANDWPGPVGAIVDVIDGPLIERALLAYLK